MLVFSSVSDADGGDGGFQLQKEHALRVLAYISSWTQRSGLPGAPACLLRVPVSPVLSCVSLSCRQCLCCFKEYKHLEVFNQLVYALINLVVAQISSLRDRLCSHAHPHRPALFRLKGAGAEWSGAEGALPRASSPGEDEHVNVERDSAEEDGGPELTRGQRPGEDPGNAHRPGEGGAPDPFGSWSTEEREKLLLCAAKIFQIQFPLYTAYKHNTHPTIEVGRATPPSRATHPRVCPLMSH